MTSVRLLLDDVHFDYCPAYVVPNDSEPTYYVVYLRTVHGSK